MIRKQVIIVNRLGLHARAAARFVKLASVYESNVELVRGQTVINGKSIMGVMMLAAAKGHKLIIRARGDDEAEALEAIETLIRERFGEKE